MSITFQAGQIYESETGARVIITKVDGDSVSFVAVDGAFVRNGVSAEEMTTMFPTYCGETTITFT